MLDLPKRANQSFDVLPRVEVVKGGPDITLAAGDDDVSLGELTECGLQIMDETETCGPRFAGSRGVVTKNPSSVHRAMKCAVRVSIHGPILSSPTDLMSSIPARLSNMAGKAAEPA